MKIDWSRLPSLTSLRAFQAVAAHGGLSAAARSLNVTHAAIAQQMRALEQDLGQRLVARSGRGLLLTPEGARLAAALDEGLATIRSGVEAVRAGGADRPVRITLTPSFASHWLMPRLRDFWQKHPDIPLSLHPDSRTVDLRREGMDLAIRYGNGSWPGVQSRLLTSARLVVAAAPEFLTDGQIGPAEMVSLPWVSSTQDAPEVRRWLQSVGLPTERLAAVEFPSEDLAIAAAREGLGLVAEDIALLEEDLRSGRLVKVFDGKGALPAYFSLTPDASPRKHAKVFLDWLHAVA